MKIKNNLYIISLATLLFMILLFPSLSIDGVTKGLIICSSIIIPSLFPFTVCVLMLMQCNIKINNKILNNAIYKLYGISYDKFFVFLMSLIGGYPIGSKLINELYKQNKISEKSANIMLIYCVNAGPTFITSAIGLYVFNSKIIGALLFLSNLFSSTLLALICSKMLKKQSNKVTINESIKIINISQIFTLSVANASECILNICSFVVIFSVICNYLEYFFKNIPILKNIWLFVDITSSIKHCKNIYVIAFLIGFSGLSVIFQVLAIADSFKINLFNFILARITHGCFNVIFIKMMLYTFKINVNVFNNSINFSAKFSYSNLTLFFSVLIMLIVFLTFIYTKNNCGKILNDVI